MKEKISLERTPDVENWNNLLNAVIVAHKGFSDDHYNAEKLEIYKTAWNKALDAAATTDEMNELIHHVPIENVHEFSPVAAKKIQEHHESAQEKIRAKWDMLTDKELTEAKDPKALLHAYENAPFDEHREVALKKLVEVIESKDARYYHDKSEAGSNLALALEEKFPEIFKHVKKPVEESKEEGGLYDMEEQEEKKKSLIQKIREALGLYDK